MDLFQPYMQLRFMSVAPIRTKKTTEHIHKGNGVGAVRATQSNSPELLKHPIPASSGIHFVTSKITTVHEDSLTILRNMHKY